MKIIILAVALFVSACGASRDHDEAATEPGAFDELSETVDRAEAVEQQLMEQKERMDRALDDAEKQPDSTTQ